MSITVGIKGRASLVVEAENTAAKVGSGTLSVFATPSMCALMEQASWRAVSDALNKGESTVGTRLNINHLSATPVGLTVWAESEVTLVDGKRIEFRVTAYDTSGIIGEGTHERFIVKDDLFTAKALRKIEA